MLGSDGQDVGTTPGGVGSQHDSCQVVDNVVDGGHGQHGPGLVDGDADGGTTVVVPGSGDECVGETLGQDGVCHWPGGEVDMEGQDAFPGLVGGQHGQGGAVDVLGHGTSSGQYDVPGQDMVSVGVKDGADGVVSTGSGNGNVVGLHRDVLMRVMVRASWRRTWVLVHLQDTHMGNMVRVRWSTTGGWATSRAIGTTIGLLVVLVMTCHPGKLVELELELGRDVIHAVQESKSGQGVHDLETDQGGRQMFKSRTS